MRNVACTYSAAPDPCHLKRNVLQSLKTYTEMTRGRCYQQDL